MDEHVLRMRTASGTQINDDPLVMFLYLLARDLITTGALDQIIDYEIPKGIGTFTNGWLAEWAKDAAQRLTKKPPNWWIQLPNIIMLKNGMQIYKDDISMSVDQTEE